MQCWSLCEEHVCRTRTDAGESVVTAYGHDIEAIISLSWVPGMHTLEAMMYHRENSGAWTYAR
jgi:hypothetical protein